MQKDSVRKMRVAIIGGGAAGFFSAITVKKNYPKSSISIFEKTDKVLSKVRISGGGRCNVTNACSSIAELSKAYPRGQKLLKKAFQEFNNSHFMDWLKSNGIALKTEKLGHVFPKNDSSETIINFFLAQAEKAQIEIVKSIRVNTIRPSESGITLESKAGSWEFDKVIITTGGSPKIEGLKWLADLGHKIETPVPSLFTFNMPNEEIRRLMGVVANQASAHIQGTKLKMQGPILITHWGMSGPAILKLSSFGARILSEMGYEFQVQIHWDSKLNYEETLNKIQMSSRDNYHKELINYKPIDIPNRLWEFLISKAGLEKKKIWGEVGKKGLNKLCQTLCNDQYSVRGKTTFKEEFVTSGGVSLESIIHKSMASKVVPNLYFAGEVLDIDGITGGYNFQAAWTTAYHAAKLL